DRKLVKDAILALAKASGLDPSVPFAKLSKKHRDLVLFGIGAAKKAAKAGDAAVPVADEIDDDDGDDEFEMPRGRRREPSADDAFGRAFEGVIPNLRRRYEEGSWAVQEDLEPF